MKQTQWIFFGFVVVLAFILTMSTGCKKQAVKELGKRSEVELPAAVIVAVKANFPDAHIDFIEVAEEASITLYDIEFKDDEGEIEVAADGQITEPLKWDTEGSEEKEK